MNDFNDNLEMLGILHNNTSCERTKHANSEIKAVRPQGLLDRRKEFRVGAVY